MDFGQVAPEEYEFPVQAVASFTLGNVWEVTQDPPEPDAAWSQVKRKNKLCKSSCCRSDINYVGKEWELGAVSHQEEGWEKGHTED